jgi:hypothetical protein
VQEAAIAFQKVLSMTPLSHPDYALYQGKVATSLSAVFELGRNMLHLEQSIQLYKSMISLMDDQDHRKRTTLYGYIGALNLRYRELGIAADLDEVIASLQQVVPFLQETNLDAVECYCRLADAFRRRFEAQGCMEDLQGAVTHFRSAALSSGRNPTRRLLAARLWVRYTVEMPSRLGAKSPTTDCFPIGKETTAVRCLALSASTVVGFEVRSFARRVLAH